MNFENYTEEQKNLIEKGFILCIECKKGYRGNRTCGANGHINYDNNSASACKEGVKINSDDTLSHNGDEMFNFIKKAVLPHTELVEVKLSVEGILAVDLGKFLEYPGRSLHSKEQIKEYIKSQIPDFEAEIKEFAKKIKDKGILLTCVKGVEKASGLAGLANIL